MQEVLLRVVERGRKVEIAQPLAYAYRVADSVIFALARKGKRETGIGDADFESELPLADEILEYKQRLEIFAQALDRLGPLRRQIFIKRYIDGKSRHEIADEQGMNIEAVKKHLVRAMAELAHVMDDMAAEGVDAKNDKRVMP